VHRGLQENGRAVIAGQQTFGKGIVQTVRELSDKNGGIAITVARYESPQHHDINKQGVAVNVKTRKNDTRTHRALVCQPQAHYLHHCRPTSVCAVCGTVMIAEAIGK